MYLKASFEQDQETLNDLRGVGGMGEFFHQTEAVLAGLEMWSLDTLLLWFALGFRQSPFRPGTL